jgi:CBS domain-containing protein
MALTIGNLLEGRDRPVCVTRAEKLSTAVELMLRHDYTQLPVNDEADRFIGMVTSDSILRALDAFGLPPAELLVADAVTKSPRFDPEEDVAELLRVLRDQYAAFVVDADEKVVGVVTGFDASDYFRSRSEDMMLVEDIESNLKEHIQSAYSGADGRLDSVKLEKAIAEVADPNKIAKNRIANAIKVFASRMDAPIKPATEMVDAIACQVCGSTNLPAFEQLTLSNYIELLLHQSVWLSYSGVFGLEAAPLRHLLDPVRQTRNALAHFRGEISATERARLRFCVEWLERHPPRMVGSATPSSVLVAHPNQSEETPADDSIEPGEGRYAKLAIWLEKVSSDTDVLSLTFKQIEEILGHKLPDSAVGHRSWWANDSVSHVQSRLWLESGWRVNGLSLASQLVTFCRTEEREAAYIAFFSEVMSRLEATHSFALKSSSPQGVGWHILGRYPEQGMLLGQFVCSFARGGRVRIEFYIDSKDRDTNKEMFDRLLTSRTDIEEKFGSPLSWERLDSRRASRIAAYRDGRIADPPDSLHDIAAWAADGLVRLRRSVEPHLGAAASTVTLN